MFRVALRYNSFHYRVNSVFAGANARQIPYAVAETYFVISRYFAKSFRYVCSRPEQISPLLALSNVPCIIVRLVALRLTYS